MPEPCPHCAGAGCDRCTACAFCGHPRARHRLEDAARDFAAAGMPLDAIARELGESPQAVRDILEETPHE